MRLYDNMEIHLSYKSNFKKNCIALLTLLHLDFMRNISFDTIINIAEPLRQTFNRQQLSNKTIINGLYSHVSVVFVSHPVTSISLKFQSEWIV